MPGQRFIDRLIADTLSERYQPCKESGDMLDTCEAVEDAMRAWQKVLKTGDLHFSIYDVGEPQCLVTFLSPKSC
jgi:hypothetical protein